MATTRDLKKFDGVNGFRVFASNISKRRVRVSVVRGETARNMHEGEIVFQEVYRSFNQVPARDVAEVEGIINA